MKNKSSPQIDFKIFLLILLMFVKINVSNLNAKESIGINDGERLLRELETEKRNFLIKIDIEEDKCLKMFLSGPCLEKLTIKHDSKIRSIEQKKQNIMRKVRRFKSDIRKKKRELKIKSKQNNSIILE